MLRSWLVQYRQYIIDSTNSAYVTYNADDAKWCCWFWFYGDSFRTFLSSVLILSITAYMSSGNCPWVRRSRIIMDRYGASPHWHGANNASIGEAQFNFTGRTKWYASANDCLVRTDSGINGSFIMQPSYRSKHINPAATTPSRSCPGLRTSSYLPPPKHLRFLQWYVRGKYPVTNATKFVVEFSLTKLQNQDDNTCTHHYIKHDNCTVHYINKMTIGPSIT